MVQLTEYNQSGYIHIVISWLCLLRWIRDICGWLREGKWCLRNLWLYYRTVRKCGWYRLWSCQQILFLPLSLRKLWFLLCLGLRYITSGSQMVIVSPPHCTICQLDEIGQWIIWSQLQIVIMYCCWRHGPWQPDQYFLLQACVSCCSFCCACFSNTLAAVSRHSISKHVWRERPMNSVHGGTSVVPWAVVQLLNRKLARWTSHGNPSFNPFFMALLSVWTKLLVRPLEDGWYFKTCMCLIPFTFQISPNSDEINYGLL